MPPIIDQDVFDGLVNVGIKEDERESLWRLALNYHGKEKDFSCIENYFIEKRDDYYLIELISAVQEDLNMDKLIEKVIYTKDQKFIDSCFNRAKNFRIFTDEDIKTFKERINGN